MKKKITNKEYQEVMEVMGDRTRKVAKMSGMIEALIIIQDLGVNKLREEITLLSKELDNAKN